MDEWVRNFIYKRFRLGKVSFSVLDLLLAVCVSGTGVFLRTAVMEYTPLTGQKIVMMVLDYCMALLAAAFILERTGSGHRVLLTYSLFVIWPIFAANSAILGGNGAFTGLLMILGLLLWDYGMKTLSILAVLGGAAAAAFGMPGAAGAESLTLGWPNIFELTGKTMFVDRYDKVSLLFMAGILLCVVYCMYRRKYRLTRELLLPMLVFLALFIPYFAPFMPAWAGYAADVLLLLWAILVPRRFYMAFLHVLVSYCAYAAVLNQESKLPMVWFSVILLVLLMDTGVSVYRTMADEKQQSQEA